MNRARWIVPVALAFGVLASAQWSYYYSQDFTSADWSNWQLAQYSAPAINTSSDGSYSGLGGGAAEMLSPLSATSRRV